MPALTMMDTRSVATLGKYCFTVEQGLIISEITLSCAAIEWTRPTFSVSQPRCREPLLPLLENTLLSVKKEGTRLLFVWSGAEHHIAVNLAELLVPEIVATKEELFPILDVSFQASKVNQNKNVTVTLNLLILDVTNWGRTFNLAESNICSASLNFFY